MVLPVSERKKKKFWLVPLFVNFRVFENVSKVKFLGAGLENHDFVTFAITLFSLQCPGILQMALCEHC